MTSSGPSRRIADMHEPARRLRRGLALVSVWALVPTLVGVLLYYPGLTMNDTAMRSVMAVAMSRDVAWRPGFLSDWFPHGMTVLLAASLRLFGSTGPLLPVMLFWFYASVGWLMVGLRAPRAALAAQTVMAMFPPIFTHAACQLPDPWTSAALCTLGAALAILGDRGREGPLPDWLTAAASGLAVIALAVLFTFRANSIVLLPLVLLLIVWLVRPRLRAGVLAACALAFGALFVKLPGWVGWEHRNTAAASLVWEHIGMLGMAKDPELTKRHAIDDLCSTPDGTAALIARHNWFTHDSVMWAQPQILDHGKLLSPDSPMRRRIGGLIGEHPKLYLRAKWEIWKTLLGLRDWMPLSWIPIHETKWEREWGLDLRLHAPLQSTTEALNERLRSVEAYYNASTAPWIYLSLAGLLAAVTTACRRIERSTGAVLLLAVGYYATFFILTPGLNYRYFLPSHVLLIAAIGAMLAALLRRSGTPAGPALRPDDETPATGT
ncbi:MAG: hypothetical protein JNM07_01575 [Phycisphaerae bacterium]|nr:hypothetical protein [Phycisphaerae bacterium]